MNNAEVNPGIAGGGFCANTAQLWQFVGIILMVLKIVIPIILIILGMIDLGKAVVSSEDKAVSKAATKLLWRIVAAVVVFFIPTIVSAIFLLMGNFSEDAKTDYDVCRTCIEHPNRETNKDNSYTCRDYVNNPNIGKTNSTTNTK